MIMNGNEVKNYLMHRWPFLLVDGVSCITTKTIEGYKNVSSSDIWFMGHFPEVSIMPGVLIIEALAQLSGIFVAKNNIDQGSDVGGKIGMLMTVKNFKFIKVVIPGDKLVLKAQFKGESKSMYIFDVMATVNEETVGSGTLQLFLQESNIILK